MQIERSLHRIASGADRTPISEYSAVSDDTANPASRDVLQRRIHREFIAGKELLMTRDLADAGNPKAQHLVSGMYRTGHGTDRDAKIAEFYLRAAAENGHPPAQLDYFDSHCRGAEVAPEPAIAGQYLNRAVDQRYAPACERMGEIYQYGIGVVPDLAQAAHYYALAHAQ